MIIDLIRRFMLAVALCLAQAMVFNRVLLYDCAMPLLYVYFAVIFPRNYPKWLAMVWCFVLGLAVDAFSNTAGLTAASLTLVGALQPYLLELFLPRDAEPNIKASATALGYANFAALATILTLVFCVAYYLLEAFGLANWLHTLACIGGSLVLTLVLIFTLEIVRKS